MRRFASAPWPTFLKVSSCLASVLLLGVGVAAARAIPQGTQVPYAEAFGALVAFVPPAIAVFAALFIVTGYDLEPGRLRIRRLLWSTPVPLKGLHHIYTDPAIMKCSIRLFGNGGLFSFTGLYRNRALGRYRAFVTDPGHSVALFLQDRIVVISPADSADFLHSVRSHFPGVQVGPPSTATARGLAREP